MTLADLRREYTLAGLRKQDLAPDPIAQFQLWFDQAIKAEIVEPNAMTLATVGADGQPSTRIVLLKAVEARGFSFFTNYESRKGRELAANPKASVTFFWAGLERQVSVRGTVSKLPKEESEAYFAVRPLGSQRGAWVSKQSTLVESRAFLEKRLTEVEAQFGDKVPMPPYWGGYLLTPYEVEFWQGRPNRLHDRLFYRHAADGKWLIERLSP